MRRGKIDHLKSKYGLALANDGYALGNCELAVRPGGVISSKAPTEAGKAAGAFGAYPSCGRMIALQVATPAQNASPRLRRTSPRTATKSPSGASENG
jgi:hypothetical protein